MLKRAVTQFDEGRSNATVATPTCSSCCCCCCCLTTAVASSTILARRVNKEARAKNVSDPIGLTVLAAMFLPVIGLVVWGLYAFINKSAGSCEQRDYISPYGNSYNYSYEVCTSPANALLLPLLFLVPVAVLTYLYARVRMGKPVVRAVAVTIVIWAAVVVEAAAGAALILTGVGGLVYLLLVPVAFTAINVLYARKILHKDVNRKNAADAWKD